MNPQNYSSTVKNGHFNKITIVIAVLVFITAVITVTAFTTKSSLNKSLAEYNDNQISIQYPSTMTSNEEVTEIKFNATEPSKDSFSAKRYAKISTSVTPDSLQRLLEISGDKVNKITIQNRVALTVAESKTSDMFERSYYVFGPTHIWRVSFSYSDGDVLSKNINNIIESFKIK